MIYFMLIVEYNRSKSKNEWENCFPFFWVLILELFLVQFVFFQCPASHLGDRNCCESIRRVTFSENAECYPSERFP